MTNKILRPFKWVCGSVWRSTAVLTVIVCAALPLMHTQMTWTSDDGGYHLQVEALQNGSWSISDPAAAVDPTGASFPYVNSQHNGDRYFPAAPRPLWALVLQLGQKIGGDVYGFLAPSIIGAIATCVACWFLSERLLKGSGAVGFWVAAVSPVMFNAYLAWAHAPDAALCGFAMLACARAYEEEKLRVRTLALIVLPFGVGCLLRSETLLLAFVAIGLLFLLRVRKKDVWASVGLAISGILVLGFVGASELWRRHIMNGGEAQLPSVKSKSGYLLSRVHSASNSLFRGSGYDPNASKLCFLILAIAAALVMYARRYRSEKAKIIVPAAIGLVLASFVWRFITVDRDFVDGLFAAWPVVMICAFALSPSFTKPKLSLRAYMFVTAGLVLLLSIATQFEEGGGVEWGGRYLSPIVPILAALVASSEAIRWISSLSKVSFASLVLVCALPITSGLVASAQSRSYADIDAQLEALPIKYVVTTIEHAARIYWRTTDKLTWVYANANDPDFPENLQERVEKAYEVSGMPVAVPQIPGQDQLPNTCLYTFQAPGRRHLQMALYPASTCDSMG